MKAALSGYFVERQELNDALRNVTRTEGGADCDRCWGVHLCAQRSRTVKLRVRTTRLRALTGRSVRRTLLRRVLQFFVVASVNAAL